MKELGFTALQVWQSLSEAQGRGRGDDEVTIVFTDLAGFSTWALDAGDTMAVELLRRVAKAVEPVMTAHGGRVVKRLGDGLMVVFRDVEEAVAAAIEAREALASVEIGGHDAAPARGRARRATAACWAATTSGSTSTSRPGWRPRRARGRS